MTSAPRSHVLVLLVACLLASTHGPVGRGVRSAEAEEDPAVEPTALTVFRGQVRELVAAWKEILAESSELRTRIERARAKARTAERAAEAKGSTASAEGKRPAAWDEQPGDRVALHQAVFPHVLRWAPPLLVLFETHESQALTPQALAQVAAVTTDRVRAWLEVGEPGTLRGVIEAAPGGIPRALALPGRPQPRRALLGSVAARVAATPGTSDLDALLAVLSWEALFCAGRTPAEQLDLVSRDLVLLFSERAEDGVTRSEGGLYVPNRFRDRGFAKALQDGSDQVRHFAWAFRMFAQSQREQETGQLLHLKEEMDARRRKQPLNTADLALNDAARDLVRRIRGSEPGTAPLDITAWEAEVRRRLGR